MVEITFQSLISALPCSSITVRKNSPLQLPTVGPAPFVPPVLRYETYGPTVQDADVLVVRAAAAVGKSTLAAALAAQAQIPVLDLSAVPVATGSLSSFVGTLESAPNIRPTILVDALDEGRLLSGDPGFRAFFESAVEALLENVPRPRLILLGRPDSANLAARFLREKSENIAIVTLDLGFFDEEGARRLVAAYADREAAPDSAYRRYTSASESVVTEYFNAIERALGLAHGQLWSNVEGRALAGYAPVLAALGVLLAQTDNFSVVAQSLRQEGRREAWSVIETVVTQILEREREKQIKKIEDRVGASLPAGAYSVSEQLALVTQHVLEMPMAGCGTIKFPEQRQDEAYRAMIEQQLPEHPFVHEGMFRNTVLGSIALAASLRRGALDGTAVEHLAEVSRHPFLWRSFVRSADEDMLIDGSSLGFLLESFWNDPVRPSGSVVFDGFDGETISASVPGGPAEMRVVVPVAFYGQMTNVQLNSPELAVRFIGRRVKTQSAQFVIKGSFNTVGCSISCGSASFETDTLVIEGSVWLSAASVEQAPNSLRLVPGTTVGWGGAILTRRPFREQQSTVEDPNKSAVTAGLEGLLSECTRRCVPLALILFQDYGVPDTRGGGGPLTWIRNNHGETFRALIKQLVAKGIARTSPYQSRGSDAKVSLHISAPWETLLRELKQVTADPSASTQYGQALLAVQAKTG